MALRGMRAGRQAGEESIPREESILLNVRSLRSPACNTGHPTPFDSTHHFQF